MWGTLNVQKQKPLDIRLVFFVASPLLAFIGGVGYYAYNGDNHQQDTRIDELAKVTSNININVGSVSRDVSELARKMDVVMERQRLQYDQIQSQIMELKK